MRVTARGKQLALAALLELALGAVFLDQLIAALSLAAFLLLALDLSSLAIREKKLLARLPKGEARVRVEAVAGQERRVPVELPVAGAPLRIRTDKDWCRLEEGGRTLVVKPPYFGRYSVKVTAVVSSAGRCFEKEVEVPVEVEVVALPRALRMLAAALEALGEVGGLEEGGRRRRTARGGTEYEGLREYTPGDKPKRIDWRVTARRIRPVVREYTFSEGGLTLLVNEDTAGPQTSDFTASAILTAALLATRLGTPVFLATVSRGVVTIYGEADPRALLLYAARKSIELLNVNAELLEYTSPQPSEKLLSALRALEASELLEPVRKRFLEVRSLVEKTPPEATLLYIGVLTSNTLLLADLVHEAYKRRVRVIVATHPKPWEDLQDQGERELARRTHAKMLSFLSRYSRVHFSPRSLEQEITPLLLKNKV
jgi:uncharacterized protein (DUF58 family)